ncbi:hypothetical protein CC2G_014447 [Coprinopsis cinerea AmutBmut pab1-1]|nr:hypothetical protein CC2G_014447 [Coprinopsis cinerea AmutBmut pab1-1]
MPRKLNALEEKTVLDASFWLGQSVRDRNTDAFVTRVTEVVSDTHNPLPHGHKAGGELCVLRRAKLRPLVSKVLHAGSADRFPILPALPWERFLSFPVGGVRWERSMGPLREKYETMRALAGATADTDRMPTPTNNVALARRFRQYGEADNVCRHLTNVRRRAAAEAAADEQHEFIFVPSSDDEEEEEGVAAADGYVVAADTSDVATEVEEDVPDIQEVVTEVAETRRVQIIIVPDSDDEREWVF